MKNMKNIETIRNFVVLEGLDGAGTTTQLDMLCSRLAAEGIPAVRTHFRAYRTLYPGNPGKQGGGGSLYPGSSFLCRQK